MKLKLFTLGVVSLVSLALAHPAAPTTPASPTPSSLGLVPLPLPLHLPNNNNNNNNHITGNFSHSCDQITLMNKYFLAATCSPITIEPGSAAPSPSEDGNHDFQVQVPPAPEFNQLDLNMCIGFDQGTQGTGTGTAGRPESGGGGVYGGRLIWQALGKFANYCTDCNLTTGRPGLSELECSCVPMTGGPGATSVTVLDLDEGVENRNGTLVCRGGMGSGIGPGPLLPED
ncbi:hypothetical protein B0H65DRAFT_170432 [Neurospora tetraspora]|uniref:Cyanovirin-N domain-containing protein n=1 Tax=Neurospora tetraspora TaxID=94610 RepID=A0AAE0JJ84_9PEZI|nr:hypothetical protein B0H65DRAFT_170432 [Neurospora tetraspora]